MNLIHPVESRRRAKHLTRALWARFYYICSSAWILGRVGLKLNQGPAGLTRLCWHAPSAAQESRQQAALGVSLLCFAHFVAYKAGAAGHGLNGIRHGEMRLFFLRGSRLSFAPSRTNLIVYSYHSGLDKHNLYQELDARSSS